MIELYQKLSRFKDSDKIRQKWYKDKYEELAKAMQEIFDIKAKDSYIEAHNHEFKVPYGKEEQDFYHDQKSKTFLGSIPGVDKKWVQEEKEKEAKHGRTNAKRQRLEERREEWKKEKSSTGVATEADVDEATGLSSPADPPPQVKSGLFGILDDEKDFDRYVMTRNRKRRLDECGEIQKAQDCDMKVRESYTMVCDDLYDFFIEFMAKGSASNAQCLLAAQLFVKHKHKVRWLLPEEAEAEKEKAELEGRLLPEDFYLYVLPSHTALNRMRKQYAMASQQGIGNLILVSLFSNILSIAEVPSQVVRGALEKAVSTAGMEFLTCDATAVEAAPSVASPEVSNQVESPIGITCSIDSPPVPINHNEFFISDFVAIAMNNDGGKTWQLAMIDEFLNSSMAKLSFFIPVPGRLGDKRVAFFPPIEDETVDIPVTAFLPLLPLVTSGTIESNDIFSVNNHEELDEVLKEVEA